MKSAESRLEIEKVPHYKKEATVMKTYHLLKRRREILEQGRQDDRSLLGGQSRRGGSGKVGGEGSSLMPCSHCKKEGRLLDVEERREEWLGDGRSKGRRRAERLVIFSTFSIYIQRTVLLDKMQIGGGGSGDVERYDGLR